MASRPTFIDIRSQSHAHFQNGLSSPRPFPSPRLHLVGDVPPDLSPLDAFAKQSQLLADQLRETFNSDRRLSRLPPLSAPLSQRPGIDRFHSAQEPSGLLAQQANVVDHRSDSDPVHRPVSVSARISEIPSVLRDSALFQNESGSVDNTGQLEWKSSLYDESPDFGFPRQHSPIMFSTTSINQKAAVPLSPSVSPRPSMESSRLSESFFPAQAEIPMSRVERDSRGLAPPRSPFFHQTPSIRSVSVDDSEDDFHSMVDTPTTAGSRKVSSASQMSASPVESLGMPYVARSPSICSDRSGLASNYLARPAPNFSRPISRASIATVDPPSRQASSDSQPSVLADDMVHTPASLRGDEFSNSENMAAPSYVYSKFSLPRGKMLQRNSRILQENQPSIEFQWEQPRPSYSNVQSLLPANYENKPPSPSERPSFSSVGRSSTSSASDNSRQYQDAREAFRFSEDSNNDPPPPQTGRISAQAAPSVISDSSTIKANSQRPAPSPAEMTAEDHVSKGVECHENGSLNESTYHLRIAAHQNHATGMLLYALACRHGWGMKANQKEGVRWLRMAAESASLEVAADVDEGGAAREGQQQQQQVDYLERKTRKAQFALSVYELGVSHMNGWGIEQDKVLALRCFEIAGAWGDGDALAEAGFCYAKGVGCKKDLKKSAKLYRAAEAKGISMIGNSWIYKAKYNDEANAEVRGRHARSPKKGRNKSRTRSVFGRKKTEVEH